MITKAQKVRLAVFFIIGFSVLLIVFVLLLGSKITEKKDYYRIIYEDSSVAGLQIGGAVLYRGIRIGRIENIEIDRNQISNIVISISVAAGTPIKADQEAILIMVGITGLKQIQLIGGSNDAPFLKSGDIIPTGRTLFEGIADRTEVLADKIEIIMDNIISITSQKNQEKLSNIIDNIDIIINQSQQPIVQTMSNIQEITVHLTTTTAMVNDLLVKLDQLFEEEKINNIVKNTETITNQLANIDINLLETQINEVLRSLNETIQRTTTMITRIDGAVQKNSPEISDIIEELRETVENLNEFTRLLADDPSLLIRSSRRSNN